MSLKDLERIMRWEKNQGKKSLIFYNDERLFSCTFGGGSALIYRHEVLNDPGSIAGINVQQPSNTQKEALAALLHSVKNAADIALDAKLMKKSCSGCNYTPESCPFWNKENFVSRIKIEDSTYSACWITQKVRTFGNRIKGWALIPTYKGLFFETDNYIGITMPYSSD